MSDNPSSFHEGATPEDFPLISVIVPVYKVERYLKRIRDWELLETVELKVARESS